MTETVLPGAAELPALECERVRLRWLTTADVPALFTLLSDPEVTRYTSLPPTATQSEAAAFLGDIERRFAERSLLQWGIARRDDDVVIGTFSLAEVSVPHGRASIGYMFVRSSWGHGYLTEVLPVMLRFAFETLGLHRLEADADPRNVASLRALERLGFRREGFQRARYVQHGERQDAVSYGLLRDDWTPGAPSVPRPEDSARGMLRHALATLAYRAAKATRDVPEGFAEARACDSARTPLQILAHMGDLMDWALHLARGEHVWRESTPRPWPGERTRLFAAIRALDDVLAGGPLADGTAERVFQGPVADALTHVGQLALLRRVAGAPVRGENYAKAHIVAGVVHDEPMSPRVEFA